MKAKNVYGQTKLRVCSGTLAKPGPKRKGNFCIDLSDEGEGKVKVQATYIDKTGTQQTLEHGDVLKVTPVAARSAYEIPREWIVPGGLVLTTWIGGPIAINYIYLKVSEGVFVLAFASVAAAQTASVFYAGAALNKGVARAIVETTKGQAVVEGDPFKIGMLAGLTHTQTT